MTEQASPPTYESTEYPVNFTFRKAFEEGAQFSLKKWVAELGVVEVSGGIAVGFCYAM